jgi:hypothetical protein
MERGCLGPTGGQHDQHQDQPGMIVHLRQALRIGPGWFGPLADRLAF